MDLPLPAAWVLIPLSRDNFDHTYCDLPTYCSSLHVPQRRVNLLPAPTAHINVIIWSERLDLVDRLCALASVLIGLWRRREGQPKETPSERLSVRPWASLGAAGSG